MQAGVASVKLAFYMHIIAKNIHSPIQSLNSDVRFTFMSTGVENQHLGRSQELSEFPAFNRDRMSPVQSWTFLFIQLLVELEQGGGDWEEVKRGQWGS